MKKLLTIFLICIFSISFVSCNKSSENIAPKKEYETFNFEDFTVDLPTKWSNSQVEKENNKIILTSVAVDEECGGSSFAVYFSKEIYNDEKIQSDNKNFESNIKKQWSTSDEKALIASNSSISEVNMGSKKCSGITLSTTLKNVPIQANQFFVKTQNGTYKFSVMATPQVAIEITDTIIRSLNFK